jgi:uncharacterized protein YdeI (YjbR/CyaY-like superfamily)
MRPSGITAVITAKQNGSWNALDLSDNLIYPPEMVKLFSTDEQAQANFEALPTGSIRNTLQWIYDAKTNVTRTKRIQQTFDAAKNNIRLR